MTKIVERRLDQLENDPPFSVTTSTLTLNARDYGNRSVYLNRAAGVALTLPAATGSGTRFRVLVGTAASGGSYVISTTSGELFKGQAFGDDGDGEPANGWSTPSPCNTITMDGSTRGGVVGDVWEFEDIATDVWACLGFITQSGTEATPFSNV